MVQKQGENYHKIFLNNPCNNTPIIFDCLPINHTLWMRGILMREITGGNTSTECFIEL